MSQANEDTINKFFEAYAKRDIDGIRQVMCEDVQWIFPGHHLLSGVKRGIDEVVDFFDSMGKIMNQSTVAVEKLVTGMNDQYVIECQHVLINRKDGNNLDHHWCVLWKFKNGKIKEGRHFASDQHHADHFFHKIVQSSTDLLK